MMSCTFMSNKYFQRPMPNGEAPNKKTNHKTDTKETQQTSTIMFEPILGTVISTNRIESWTNLVQQACRIEECNSFVEIDLQ